MGIFSRKSKETVVVSPANGRAMKTSELSDQVFAGDFMGKGIAIEPTDGKFHAPFDGEMVTVFPTGHAYGIKSNSGVEMLIHIGMDTVQLNGKGFDVKVKQGQKVKQGDLMVIADLEYIKSQGKPTETPMIITSEHKDSLKDIKSSGELKIGDVIFKI